MSEQKQEFVAFALRRGSNISELSRRYGISRKSAYALLNRYRERGDRAFVPCSRRPKNSPNKTSDNVEKLLLQSKAEIPEWGPRKIRKIVEKAHPQMSLPSVSTVASIFERNGVPKLSKPEQNARFKGFERGAANELWQMDFKGHVQIKNARSHPLCILDDHSRFCIGLKDCRKEDGVTVQVHLHEAFIRYGLPDQILCDNGAPWGSREHKHAYNALSVWLFRLGIKVLHGRAYHPQTQGKAERFNKTLKLEVLNDPFIATSRCLQRRFDHFRERYNTYRPHQSLCDELPIEHYEPSKRSMPSKLPQLEYYEHDIIRKVKSKGEITFKNQFYYIGSAFKGLEVALRQQHHHRFDVYFATVKIGSIDLKAPTSNKFKYITIR